jgi:hypothetical protein
MPSPFPGMDPHLESPAFWSDFHATFINYWREAVADYLPDHYEARIDERVNLVEVKPERIRRFEPDVAISRRPGSAGAAPTAVGVATVEPVVVPLLIEEETRETYVQLLHRRDRTVVAILELLSPSNKDPDSGTYLARRNTLLHRDVHVVELDLLQKGQRIPLREAYPAGQYFTLVADATRRPDCDVYAWTMRQPLPPIPIPLRPPDSPVWIDLAAVFAITYERGRYARSIDYSQPPPIALRGDDLTWALERARSRPAT